VPVRNKQWRATMLIIITAVLFSAALAVNGEVHNKLTCQLSPADVPKDWITMTDPCVKKMSEQVMAELNAAMVYLAMGAHFNRDNINRPGFSKLFFHSASEEREHAMKLIEYLLMRGELTEDVRALIQNPVPNKSSWADAVTALREALELEASVTRSIRDIIKVCEEPPEEKGVVFNDYHLADYLTGEFLEEQYSGQRVLAGHISTLGKLMDTHGPIGEFLFDKRLLAME